MPISRGQKKKVFIGMSGGVDSSVAALLLKEQGYDAVGVFMRCYNIDGCAERDAEDARRVAEHIKIPFYVWDFEEEYKRLVVEYMIEGYRQGITPNPDVMCNREIKFGLFLKKALEQGADYVATGHYVRIKEKVMSGATDLTGRYALYEAIDKNKDQSYFLWTLTQDQLKHCLFPIGDYVKPDVRALARKAGLPTAEKKDSQGVCFLGNVDVAEFLKKYISEHRGALLTTSGATIGEHFGSEFYTIGQRHIDADFVFPKTGGAKERKAYYVASKDARTNTVVMAEGAEHHALYKTDAAIAGINIIDAAFSELREPGSCVRLRARVRYRQPLFPAMLYHLENGDFVLRFKERQKFVASGQSAVFYGDDGEMLGGGIIR